jgi:proteic killer suppression protein
LAHRVTLDALLLPWPASRAAVDAITDAVLGDGTETLDDMRVPPGNRLEKLRGDRSGQYSIRVNQQWRWSAEGPTDIEIVDYH